MKIKIRLATLSDLNKLMGIFDTARRFMQSTGNANQWINGHYKIFCVNGKYGIQV